MKLDEKNIAEILKNTDFKNLQNKIKGIDIDPVAIQNLMQSFDPIQLEKAMAIMNSSSVKKSIGKVNMNKIEGFTNRSYKEGMINQGMIEKLVKNYDRYTVIGKNEDQITYTDNTTIEEAFDSATSYVEDMSDNIMYIVEKIDNGNNINRTLNKVKRFLEDETKNMSKNFIKDNQKRDVNKRISEFYDKDKSIKKDLLVYLKYLYTFLFVFFILTVFYKKRYKEKKIYIAIALLFLIPNFLIKLLYDKMIDIIGHTKLDLLYTSMIVITTVIIIGLFLLMKYVLKPGEEIDLINIGKISKSITDNIKNKSLNFSEKQNKTNTSLKSDIKNDTATLKAEENKN